MIVPFEIEADHVVAYRARTPVVLHALLLSCLLLHAWLSFSVPTDARMHVLYRFGAVKFRFAWWSAVTCMFLHGGWGHLLGNMYFLWIYGREVERYVGHRAFLILYVVGGFVSIAVHLLSVSPFAIDEPTIGASGAISAVLGAFLVFWPMARLRCAFFSIISFRPIVIQLPAFVVLGLWFAGQLLYTLKLAGDIDHIAFWAHVAGFAAGAGLGTLFEWLQRQSLREMDDAAKEPLIDAWQAYLRSDLAAASARLEELDDRAVLDSRGFRQMVRGLVGLQAGGSKQAASRLVRALCQARDYRQDAAILTVYLQMLKTMPAHEIPAFVHKEGGFAALTLKRRDIMLQAFSYAVHGGCEEGLVPMLRAVEATVKRAGA